MSANVKVDDLIRAAGENLEWMVYRNESHWVHMEGGTRYEREKFPRRDWSSDPASNESSCIYKLDFIYMYIRFRVDGLQYYYELVMTDEVMILQM